MHEYTCVCIEPRTKPTELGCLFFFSFLPDRRDGKRANCFDACRNCLSKPQSLKTWTIKRRASRISLFWDDRLRIRERLMLGTVVFGMIFFTEICVFGLLSIFNWLTISVRLYVVVHLTLQIIVDKISLRKKFYFNTPFKIIRGSCSLELMKY